MRRLLQSDSVSRLDCMTAGFHDVQEGSTFLDRVSRLGCFRPSELWEPQPRLETPSLAEAMAGHDGASQSNSSNQPYLAVYTYTR